MQFDQKTILAFHSVKNDPRLSDLVKRCETNVSNFGTLSAKALQQLVKLHEKDDESATKQATASTYERLATLGKKISLCWQT